MKKIIALVLLSICILSCNSTKKPMVKATKDKDGNLVGQLDITSFDQEPYKEWFDKNYADYKLNDSIISVLKPHLKDVKIVGFMGTWCEDSQRETPVFYKILNATNFNQDSLQLIAVDEDKKAPKNFQKGFDITNVPTFIFFKDGKEIGRFVEYAIETVEEDFLKITSGQDYKHAYEE